jgi:hypothetical protein
MNNTEDIDREIKKIQLQREQLSLKRELANERLKQSILEKPKVAGQFFGRVLINLMGLALSKWRLIVGIALVASSAAGVNAWLEYRAREEARIASERYYRELDAYVEKTCGRFCSFGDTGDYISFDGGACKQTPGRTHGWCKMEAESSFRSTRVQR